MSQYSLFNSIDKKVKETKNNLVISAKDSTEKNNKKTIEIDKKIRKIEQLKEQIKKINNTVAIAKKLYDKQCKKAEENLSKAKEHLIIKLYQRFNQNGFSLWQKEMIESKILNEIDTLLISGYESKILSNIQEEINKQRLQNLSDEERNIMNEFSKDFFKNMGVDIDEENFNFEDFKNQDFKKEFDEKYSKQNREEYENFFEENNKEKHKSQKEKLKATDTDFRKLYKNLVKKAHPDLVTNQSEKEIREEWMKKLSLAWENRNYYELLLLKKEIDNEDSTDITVSDSQLKSLIIDLNKMINQLEADKYRIKYHDSESSFYFENFNASSDKGILKKIMEYKKFVNHQTKEVEEDKISLKTQKSTKELLVKIRNSNSYFNEDYF